MAPADPPDPPGPEREERLDLYRWLCLSRAAEERLEILQKQGHVTGGLYRSLGQEAGAVGVAYPLRRRRDGSGDVLAPTVRAAGALFLFGGELVDFFRQYMARGTGPTRGREANVHWVDLERGFVGPVSPLGTMVGVMAGITLSFKLRGEDRVGVVFNGDGASSTGAWHEGLCVAAAQRCPMILVVEANQWAFSTPTRLNTRLETFTGKARAYGIRADAVDGTDVLETLGVVRAAAERARAGEGVQLVELRYYRMRGHAQHDPQDYVDPDELARWAERDPIERYGRRLLESGTAAEDELEALRAQAEEACREAADRAVAEPSPEGLDAVADVYTDHRIARPWTRAAEPSPSAA